MPQDPNSGESLSALRRRAGGSRWTKKESITLPPPVPAAPQVNGVASAPVKKAVKKAVAPAWTEAQQQRLKEITDDAVAAYNMILARPSGSLQRVTPVGIERRRKEVSRVVKVASRICTELYGNPKVTPQFWEQYFGEVNRDDFRAGRKQGGPGHEGWKPGFEFLTREKTMLDVFEGAVSRHG